RTAIRVGVTTVFSSARRAHVVVARTGETFVIFAAWRIRAALLTDGIAATAETLISIRAFPACSETPVTRATTIHQDFVLVAATIVARRRPAFSLRTDAGFAVAVFFASSTGGTSVAAAFTAAVFARLRAVLLTVAASGGQANLLVIEFAAHEVHAVLIVVASLAFVVLVTCAVATDVTYFAVIRS